MSSPGRSGWVDLPQELATARSRELLDCAAINKDTAFDEEERAPSDLGAFCRGGSRPSRSRSPSSSST